MFRNYFKTAIRQIWKNKAFSFLNITGLALGIACSLLILLWVKHEMKIDAFHSDSDQLFVIYERQYHDGQIDAGYYTPGQLAEELKKKIPEIEMASAFAWENTNTFQVGDKILKEKGNSAGKDFFKMFNYPLIKGDKNSALNDPLNIVISEKMAKDFFGSADEAMGKTLRYENRKDLKVSAVFADVPDISSSKFDFLLTWEEFLLQNEWAKEWGNNGPATYFKIRKDADPEKVELKLTKFLEGLNTDMNKNFYIELGMQPVAQTYLHGTFKDGKIVGGRIEYVRMFSIVAIFILLIACINFMNLTTARSVKRAKEIGIRKVAGAFRALLIRQFMGEALLITAFSVILALGIVLLLLPAFNNVTGKEISLPYSQPGFWIILIVLTAITGLVSGSYPALFLSNFEPIRVLKGTLKFSSGATWFRKGLVVFQFMLSILLIIGTIVVSMQINYVQNINLGYDRENLIYIPVEGDLAAKYKTFKTKALASPGIQMVTRITQNPTSINNGTGGVQWEGKDPNAMHQFVQAATGYDFVKAMKLKMIDGRDFSADFATDSVGYIINEAAAKIIKYDQPVGKWLTFWQKKGTIVGVLKDFHFTSLHEPIRPLVIRLGEEINWGWILVRTEPGKTKQALTSLESISKELNPQFPFTYDFSDQEYKKLYKSEEIIGRLSNAFAFLAIFISCLGLLGLAMFTAEQRTKEMGIRKVLGASTTKVFSLLSREFLILVGIAFVIATPLSVLATSGWLKNFAYRTPVNWWIYAIAGLLAVLIALITVSFQAIKAAVANPVKSLRSE
ncbi:ABC transporter permease [Pollutibacter soli]|uniref:ABC transporter permease n=1 Tax=Pollutibacter soli TaxID=3034157 RepID=UPI00301373D4